MRIRRLLAVVVLLVVPLQASAAWYDNDWQYRMPITLDSTQVDAALNDFPVLIDTRNEDAFVRDNLAQNVASAAGDDIVITASDGTTVLPHEIEFFDDGSGELVAWVRIPTLDDAADTELYIYYGNASAGNMQQPEQVWNSAYRMVQHLQEPGDGNSAPAVQDSTANGNDGSLLADQPPRRPTYLSDQQIDGARRPVGERRSRIEVPHSGSLGITNEITVEAWARIENPQPTPDHNPVLWKGEYMGWGANYHFRIGVVGNEITWGVTCGGSEVWEHEGSPAFDQWAHYALVLDRAANELRGYINGQLVMSRGGCGSTALNTFSSEPVLSGWGERLSPAGDVHYQGGIDEIRITAAALAPAWLSTQYNNQNNPAGFHTFGPEEQNINITLDPIYEFQYEESAWDGTSGEVEDLSGNGLNGTAQTGTTDDTEPARAGDPGTCRYGDFASGGYVTAPGSNLVNDADSFSIAAWINTPYGDQTSTYPVLMSYGDTQGDDYAERWELYLDLSSFPEDWVLAVRKSNGNIEEVRFEVDPYSSEDPLDGNWVHVVATYDAQSKDATIYANGAEIGSAGTGGPQTLTDAAGDLGLFAHPDGTFDAVGRMDEPRVYAGVLTSSEVDAIYQETHPCTAQVAYYNITHPGTGLTCASTPVTVEAMDADDNPVEPAAGTTVSLSSDLGGGYWSTLLSGSGSFSSGPDGTASYAFPGGESAFQVSYDYTAIGSDPTAVTPTAVDGDGNGSVANTIAVSRAGFRFIDRNTGNATIPFQVAGKPSDTGYSADDIGLQAVRESDDDPTTCEGVYADGATATVGLGAECRDPATCGSEQVTVNGTAIATSDDNGDSTSVSAYTDVNLIFGPNSIAPLSLNYMDVGEIDLYAAAEIQRDDDTGSGDFMTGSSNNFVWRPFGFHVDSPALTSGAVGPNEAVFAAAGDNFTVDVRAVAWEAADDSNADGQPDDGSDLSNNPTTTAFGAESQQSMSVTLLPQVSAPATGSNGALSNSSLNAFSNGTDQIATNWSEVGYVDLAAELDTAYLGTEVVTGRGDDAGRFIPDHFHVTVNPADPQLLTGCDTNFSYLGQPTGYDTDPVVTIVPRNHLDQKTTNYDDFTADGEGNWWKLEEITADYTETNPAMPVEVFLDDGAATQSDDGTAPNGPAQVDITFGGELSHAFISNQAPDVEPFSAQPQISFDVADSDGVEYDSGSPYELGIGYSDSDQIRHGRLNIGNAHGSELLDLNGVVVTEYYVNDEGGWQTSAADDCTGNDEDIALVVTGTTGALSPGDTCIIEPNDESGIGCNGSSDATKDWTEPPSGGDFNAWFRAPTGGQTGSAEIAPSNMPGWLQYNWDPNATSEHNQEPSGVITFGIYEGQERRIDLRETW